MTGDYQARKSTARWRWFARRFFRGRELPRTRFWRWLLVKYGPWSDWRCSQVGRGRFSWSFREKRYGDIIDETMPATTEPVPHLDGREP